MRLEKGPEVGSQEVSRSGSAGDRPRELKSALTNLSISKTANMSNIDR